MDHKLCHVQQTDAPLAVGSLLVKQGAWQRKYQVVNITEQPGAYISKFKTFVVEIKPLGDFYATGRFTPARRAKSREIVAVQYGPAGTSIHVSTFIHVTEAK